ncbi:lipopolysaccharide export system permease protein [Candidatus Pelagibacter ubique]|uniref:Lipopolysaccharide export system permease protein n=1 Tax=Pelagibacter ubique TaxID=198252 RepID=A0ABX1SYJ9_PELUQ|nr:LptF/LptG family permease [Candidatus Pelagibacter ubique]NMN66911.1 lipopolysaccharide export system permease protein [Candidatus Pelagibacter ubique]
MYFKLYQKNLVYIFLKVLSEITIIFFSLIFIMGLIEEIAFFRELNENFFYPILLTLFKSPTILYDIFPFIFIISTQFFFIKIIENNELSLFKTIGISNLKIVWLLIVTSFVLSLIINIIFYNFSAQLKYQYLVLKNNFSTDNKYLAVINQNGLWIRDLDKDKVKIINSSRLKGNFIEDVEITEFDKDFNLIKTIHSKRIDISKNDWIITNAEILKDNNTTFIDYDFIYNTNFNSEKIRNYFSDLKSLSIFELYDAKKNYQKLGYSTNDIEVHLFKFYTYPFYLTIMTLFSCVIMLNLKYNRPKIFHIILGVMVSVIIYYINLFSNVLGQSLDFSGELSALLPMVIISLSCCIGLIKINEK